MLFGTPVVNKDFRWDVTLNWAKNNNEVISLAEGIDNLQLKLLCKVVLLLTHVLVNLMELFRNRLCLYQWTKNC